MKRLHALVVCVVFLLLGIWTQLAAAQNANSGVVEGVVKDTTGSVVPDVSVDIRNVQTGISRVAKTNSFGLYTVPSVLPGEYTITFSRLGFENLVRQGVIIVVGVTSVDGVLHVGKVSEQVTVSGRAPLLQAETSDQTTTIETHVVESMPFVGSDWRALDGVLPGVDGGTKQNASGQYVGYNGTQGNSIAWLFDGSGAVLPHDYNPSQIYPPVEAIEEVSASTSNFSAEYGNGMAVLNVISKSGTNQIHGDVFEMFQNDKLEARNFFSVGVSPLRWNQFGGSVGGPIIKKKLFLFFDYMENPAITYSPNFYTFPTAAMRQGNFSGAGFPTVYDPRSLTYVSGVATRTALNGNIVTTLDPVAAKIQAFWPTPNYPTLNNSSLYNNYYADVQTYETNRWYEGKTDYVVNDRNRISVSELVAPQNRPGPDPRTPLDTGSAAFKDQATQITYTTTINPNVVNEVRLGYVREIVRDISFSQGRGFPAQIGLINAPADIFPTISVTGTVASELDGDTPYVQAQGTYHLSDIITLVRGKQVVKIGGEYDRSYQNLTSIRNIQAGTFTFTGMATRNPAISTSTGLGFADFLFGLPYSWSVTESLMNGTHMANGAAFVQDDYKLLPKLTLNLGLRYQSLGGWHVKHNNFGIFDPTLNNPTTNTPGAMVFGGEDGRDIIQNAAPLVFAPRVGFAWTPFNKWAVRGSYAIFDMVRSADPYTNSIVGVASNTTGSLTSSDNVSPVFTLGPNESYNQGYVQGPPLPVVPNLSNRPANLLNGQNVTYEATSIPTQYVQEVYLNVQHEIPAGILLSAGYVLTKGEHLQFERDINQVPQSLLGPGNTQNLRPYPQFLNITGVLWDGISNYNALQLRAEKRTSRGLLFIANYAYSKTMDTGTGGGNTTSIDTYQNAHNIKSNYGLSELDTPNMINGVMTYDLPFGVGRQYVNTHGFLEHLVGGWRVGAYFQLHGGLPFTPVIGTSNNSSAISGTWFPNRVGNGALASPTIHEWFNTSAFQTPASYTFGNSGRDILRGPDWRSLDANLGKVFPIRKLGEAGGLELRVDAFDLPNNPNFGQPNAKIGTSGAGIISSANTSRNIQLTGRIRF
jgi:hypothetical protein